MAKFLMKSKGVGAVLDSHKQFHQIVVKTNPALTNVSTALLKWAVTESNLSMFDVFSAWSDLNYAMVELSNAVNKQLFAFHQTFKNIQSEEKNLTKMRTVAENASKRVRQAVLKLDSAKKAKKKEKDQIKIDNCESELTLAMGQEKESLAMLTAKEKEFESNKATWVKQILGFVSGSYVEYLEKCLRVWREKQSIVQAMAEEPVYSADNLNTDSHRKVSSLFKEFSIDLPPRGTPSMDKARTMPGPPPPVANKTSKTMPTRGYMSSVSPVTDTSFESDEEAYAMPGDPPSDDPSSECLSEDYLPVKEKDNGPSPPSVPGREPSSPNRTPPQLPPPNNSPLPPSVPPREPLPDPTPPRLPPPNSTPPQQRSSQPPPRIPLPRSPPPSHLPRVASFSSLDEIDTSSDSSSNLSENKTQSPARQGFKVLPVLPGTTRLKPALAHTQSQPPERLLPMNEGMPPTGGDTPSTGRDTPPTDVDISSTRRKTPPPGPPPRLAPPEMQESRYPNDVSYLPGSPKPPNKKKPVVGPKPIRPPKPNPKKQASKDVVDPVNIEFDHEYSDVPVEGDRPEEDRHERLKKINGALPQNNNNFQQVIESDSDFSDDYEMVDGKR